MFDDWEYRLMKERAEALAQQADEHLHGSLALEPNDPQRETQVNQWTEELRRARGLLAKLETMKH